MSFAYKIYDQHSMYYVTFTVHQWADVFTRSIYIDIVLESLRFCQKEKGLKVYAWVIMSNHIHLILRSDTNKLSDIIRDFKKYTSSRIVKAIENNPKESRRNWLLWLLKKEGKIWFWEEGYHGVEITSPDFFETNLNYIHLNPVRAKIVERAEDYYYSSCADYLGKRKGLLDVEFI
jgi:REP element-mobilizing transposase RayT